MSEYCQVISRENFKENTALYRYSPTTGHFEIGVENAAKVPLSEDRSHITPSTSRQIENGSFEYDPAVDVRTHISPSVLLEHNYCSYPPTMATLISSVLVTPAKPPICSESLDKHHSLTPAVESICDITKPLDTEIDIEIASDNNNQTSVEHSCLLTPVSEKNSDMSSSPNEECSNTDSFLPCIDAPLQPVIDEFPNQDVEVVCEAAEQIVEQVSEERTVIEDKPDEKTERIENTDEEDFVTRCICGFQHDDGYMICCDKCQVWQHVDCMEIERNNIPEEYLCEECAPRKVNHTNAVSLQKSKLKNFALLKKPSHNTSSNSSDHSDGENAAKGAQRNKKESSTNKRKKNVKSPIVVKKRKAIAKREAKNVKKADIKSVAEHSADSVDRSGELRVWIDEYEEAITNHYSPELRARISSLKLNGIHSHQKLIGAHQSRPKSKASNINSVQKVLTATCYIPPSHPIIEIRGKYMLPKGGALSPPEKWKEQFLFDHCIIGPGQVTTDIRVDTTTYGNNARFVRSSCYPNAEIQHCVEKGTLHVYIVSTEDITSKCEITLPHRPGAECVFGNKCTLVSPVRRRNRKQILIERSVSKDSYNINNNNYKEFPSKKRLVPAMKATKSLNVPSNEDSQYKVTRRSSILKRNESKGRR